MTITSILQMRMSFLGLCFLRLFLCNLLLSREFDGDDNRYSLRPKSYLEAFEHSSSVPPCRLTWYHAVDSEVAETPAEPNKLEGRHFKVQLDLWRGYPRIVVTARRPGQDVATINTALWCASKSASDSAADFFLKKKHSYYDLILQHDDHARHLGWFRSLYIGRNCRRSCIGTRTWRPTSTSRFKQCWDKMEPGVRHFPFYDLRLKTFEYWSMD